MKHTHETEIIPEIIDEPAKAGCAPGNETIGYFAGEISRLRSLLNNQPGLNELSKTVHVANAKWWQDIETGQPIKRNKGELLALIHSEISEALEGERKNLMDDKLPQYPMAAVEIVDAIIRSLDYLAGFHPEIDVQEVFDAKMAYNAKRADHTHEARRIAGGKQF